jgi:uncharacterized protein
MQGNLDTPKHDEPATPPVEAPGGPSRDECMMGMIAHALGISTSFLGPLLIWQTKGKESAFVNQQAKEALNYQITLATILLACWNFAPDVWFPYLLSGYLVVNTVFSVPALIAAAQGKPFRYWLPIRLID